MVLSGILYSCVQNDDIAQNETQVLTEDSDNMTILGEERSIPSSISNMDNAYAFLKSENPNLPEFKAKTTHLYMRFLPKDEAELDYLKEDTTMIWFETPLHYKVEKQGHYYHDPSLPEDQITWQYIVLEVEKEIPNVYHELIEELCLHNNGELKSQNINDRLFTEIQKAALKLSKPNDNLKSVAIADWRPSGNLTVDGVPLQGVEVRIVDGFLDVDPQYTDEYGNFTGSRDASSPVDYEVNWERYQFVIREGTSNSVASIDAQSQTTSWEPNLDIYGSNHYHPSIFLGAHDMYYGNIYSLSRPPQNGLLVSKMKIQAINSNNPLGGGAFGHTRSVDVKASISPLNLVFGSTVHELAHAAHWINDKALFESIADDKVIESWGVGELASCGTLQMRDFLYIQLIIGIWTAVIYTKGLYKI